MWHGDSKCEDGAAPSVQGAGSGMGPWSHWTYGQWCPCNQGWPQCHAIPPTAPYHSQSVGRSGQHLGAWSLPAFQCLWGTERLPMRVLSVQPQRLCTRNGTGGSAAAPGWEHHLTHSHPFTHQSTPRWDSSGWAQRTVLSAPVQCLQGCTIMPPVPTEVPMGTLRPCTYQGHQTQPYRHSRCCVPGGSHWLCPAWFSLGKASWGCPACHTGRRPLQKPRCVGTASHPSGPTR